MGKGSAGSFSRAAVSRCIFIFFGVDWLIVSSHDVDFAVRADLVPNDPFLYTFRVKIVLADKLFGYIARLEFGYADRADHVVVGRHVAGIY